MKIKLIYLILLLTTISFSACKKDKESPKGVPMVTTVTATVSDVSSATVSGRVTGNGNSPVTVTGFVYSSNVTIPTIADNKIELTDTEGDFSTILEGLNSGTTYHVRAYATNGVGTGYGDVIDFTTGNAGPVSTNLTIAGTAEVGKILTANYTYVDAENNPEGATTFQWYSATSAAGEGETIIAGATAKTFMITDAENGKFLRVSVIPKATTGTETGLEAKSAYSGAVGAEKVTFTYNGTAVTYGTITSTQTGRKWLDRNLGAARSAQSIDDYQAYGDLFQWGRDADGHQVMARSGPKDGDALGVNGITSTTAPYATSTTDNPGTNKFIVVKTLNSPLDWRSPQDPNTRLWQGVDGVNNPCPAGWRMPTKAEWIAEGFTDGADAFNKLGLTYNGQRSNRDGAVSLGVNGFYWSSTGQESTITPGTYVSIYLVFNATKVFDISTATTNRAYGHACRCIKN